MLREMNIEMLFRSGGGSWEHNAPCFVLIPPFSAWQLKVHKGKELFSCRNPHLMPGRIRILDWYLSDLEHEPDIQFFSPVLRTIELDHPASIVSSNYAKR